MADVRVVLYYVLCFLTSKYGKIDIKMVMSDFYTADLLSVAKFKLLEAVGSMIRKMIRGAVSATSIVMQLILAVHSRQNALCRPAASSPHALWVAKSGETFMNKTSARFKAHFAPVTGRSADVLSVKWMFESMPRDKRRLRCKVDVFFV